MLFLYIRAFLYLFGFFCVFTSYSQFFLLLAGFQLKNYTILENVYTSRHNVIWYFLTLSLKLLLKLLLLYIQR